MQLSMALAIPDINIGAAWFQWLIDTRPPEHTTRTHFMTEQEFTDRFGFDALCDMHTSLRLNGVPTAHWVPVIFVNTPGWNSRLSQSEGTRDQAGQHFHTI